MSIAIKKNIAVGIKAESSEGTYAAPGATTDYVQILDKGFDLTGSRDLLKREVFTASIGETSPRTGQQQVKGALPVEAKAHSTAGHAPEYDVLMKSALGNRRQMTTTVTTKTGNSASVLQIQDADISKFTVGDIILIKESGAYHVSPVTAVDSTGGAANITILIPRASSTFPDNVVIDKNTIYYPADSGHPVFSVSKYLEGTVLEAGIGCRVSGMALENFATGQLPSFKFSFEGLSYTNSVTSNPYTPAYDTALPPIILSAHLYMDSTEVEANELGINLTNKIGFESAFSASNGRIAGRATERTITGTFNPYKQSDSVSNFTKYSANTAFSLFAYAMVPTGVAGQFGNIVAVYMPNCLITDLGEADQDGLLQQTVSFSANRGTAGTTPEMYLGFI